MIQLLPLRGDITKVEADAIVNAANSSLLGGGGVDGAIHRAGGPEILDDCRKIIASQGGCKTGDAVITRAGNLKAKFVIHTVGPVWRGGHFNEKELLAQCYSNSLNIAVENRCRSVAFPCISTGVYHFPKQLAAMIAVKTVVEFIKPGCDIERILFVCFDDESFQDIQTQLKLYSDNF
jgi:O-acetyl-ADP-ribose deacetylase